MNLPENLMPRLRAACASSRVKELHLFGSALTDRFSEASDLDFLVTFDREGHEGSFARYFDLKEELERVFEREVDLVCYRAIRNPWFKEEVDASKRLIYVA